MRKSALPNAKAKGSRLTGTPSSLSKLLFAWILSSSHISLPYIRAAYSHFGIWSRWAVSFAALVFASEDLDGMQC